MRIPRVPLCTILFFFLISICAQSQVDPHVPKWAILEDVKSVGSISEREIADGYHYVLYERQYNIIESHRLVHHATKVITEAGLSAVSSVEVYYDPSYQKASIHFIKIHRGNTVIDRTNANEIQVLSEESDRAKGLLYGMKTLYVNLSDLRKGDIIEYCYSVKGKNPSFGNYFTYDLSMGYSVPVGRIKYKFILNKDAEPAVTYKNCDLQPLITTGTHKEYTWMVNNPKVQKQEDGTPSWYNSYPTVNVTNFASWKEVKSWAKGLFKTDSPINWEVKDVTDSIVINTKGLEKQITACVDFVQNHIRYQGNENGIYSHKPHTPEYVLKNRFGDCKDKSQFLITLLKPLGIRAYPVLLNTSLQKSILQESPSLTGFDHCITMINYLGKQYFIDPTASYQAGSFVTRKLPNYEMLMALDSSDNIFTVLPPDQESKIEIEENFIIDKNTGNASLTAKFKFTGSKADDIRYYFATNSLNDIQENFQGVYKNYADDVEILDSIVYTDSYEKNELVTTEHYLLKNFWKNKDGSTLISKGFVPYSLNDKIVYVNEKSRNSPLSIAYPVNISQKITVFKEGGFNVEENEISEDNPFFNFHSRTGVKDQHLVLSYSFVAKTGVIEPADYHAYHAKTDFLDKNLVYTVEQNASNSSFYGFNWLLLAVLGISAVISVFLCLSLYNKTMDYPYECRYDSIGGWLILIAIGVVFNPVSLLYSLIKIYMDEFSVSYFYHFFNEESIYYNPLRGYHALSVCALNVLLLVFSIMLIFVFFRRKNSFRVYYCAFKIFNILLLSYDIIMSLSLSLDINELSVQKEIQSQKASIFRLCIQACIWLPYLWVSERSKHTFTVGNTVAESNAEIGVEVSN